MNPLQLRIFSRSGVGLAGSRPQAPSSTRSRLVYALTAVLLLVATTVRAQTAADSTVALIWTATGDDGLTGTAARYDIRYRTVPISGTDTLTWWSAATPVTGLSAPSAAGATDSARVRGLQPTTTYYFVLRVADEVPNWSAFSNVAVKTTSGDITPPSTITDLAVTATTGTSASLRWTAPGDDGTTGTAASYDIRYSTTPITSSNWGSATLVTGEPAPTVAGTTQSFTVNGLVGSRTYYFAIKATDNQGNVSLISNTASGTTLDVIPPSAVRDLSLIPLQPEAERDRGTFVGAAIDGDSKRS